MKTKRVLKESVKKKLYISIVIVVTLIIVASLIKHFTSSMYKLTKLGYSKEVAKEIISIKKANRILKLEYNDAMLDILKGKYYIDTNLEKYLSYYNENKTKDINDIISIVNVHADNKFYEIKFDTDTSMGNAMLVNKFYMLNSEYNPELVNVSNWYCYGTQKLQEEAYNQFVKMFNEAKKENLTLIINDSYRTYEEQEKSHKRYGDDYAARAGSSEHQTGLAIDVVSPNSNGETFENTNEYKWLQNHAHEYGFILRYPKGKEHITGYEYESWHYRYLGVDLATKVRDSGLTYEEYYAYYLDK